MRWLAVACLALGCRGEPGRTYACDCAMLTDFDDGSVRKIEICAPSAERAPEIGRGCAQIGAPAPVQSCACKPTGETGCAPGACSVRETP